MGIQVLESTEDHAIGSWRGAVLYVWRKRTTMPAIATLEGHIRRHAAGSDPAVIFGFVDSQAVPPSAPERDAIAALLKIPGSIVASAVTFQGVGFQAAMIRFVATALTMLSRPAYPHRAFGSPTEGASFLNKQIVAAGRAAYPEAELVGALDALRAAPLSARSPSA